MDIDSLIEIIKVLKEKLPELNKEGTFTAYKETEFKIENLGKDISEISEDLANFFSNCINWKSPRTQFNITPPITISSAAVLSLVALLNPNAAAGIASGEFAKLERNMIKYFSELVGWKDSSGVFTFGGTATNMYGVRIGIGKSNKEHSKKGVKDGIYVISNTEGHSCHINICNWLGIGTDNCIRLDTDKNGVVSAEKVLENVEQLLKEGKIIGCIILNCGTNFNGEFDPIEKVSVGINELVKKYNLDYTPHIHADSVIGWVFLLFEGYDFEKNELKFPKEIKEIIKKNYELSKTIKFADSFGIDFHKTGFAPYLSSLFVTKNKRDWNVISSKDILFAHQSFNLNDYKPGKYTLETSRPVNGAISAYATLKSLGRSGIMEIIANLIYVSRDLRKIIPNLSDLFNMNLDSKGWCTITALKNEKFSNFEEIYNCNLLNDIQNFNSYQKRFYDYLINKYGKKIPWNIGFCETYTKNKYGYPISGLKNYPMSPFITIKDNIQYIDWVNENFKEFKHE